MKGKLTTTPREELYSYSTKTYYYTGEKKGTLHHCKAPHSRTRAHYVAVRLCCYTQQDKGKLHHWKSLLLHSQQDKGTLCRWKALLLHSQQGKSTL